MRPRKLLLVFALCAACGGPARDPEQPQPRGPTSATITKEQCAQQGGHVRGDISDGSAVCAAGERDAGRVLLGIEGGVCCVPPPMTPIPP